MGLLVEVVVVPLVVGVVVVEGLPLVVVVVVVLPLVVVVDHQNSWKVSQRWGWEGDLKKKERGRRGEEGENKGQRWEKERRWWGWEGGESRGQRRGKG